jgi:hypothetical protein
MVKPSEGILDDILGKLGGKYDIKVFEKLDISEYFYFFRKLWRGMEHRIARNEFTDFAERMRYRRKWLNLIIPCGLPQGCSSSICYMARYPAACRRVLH